MTDREKQVKEAVEHLDNMTGLEALKIIESNARFQYPMEHITIYGDTVLKTQDIMYYTIKIYRDLCRLDAISKYIKYELQEQDGYYFIQIGNEPLKSITKEEYDILKRWKDDNT